MAHREEFDLERRAGRICVRPCVSRVSSQLSAAPRTLLGEWGSRGVRGAVVKISVFKVCPLEFVRDRGDGKVVVQGVCPRQRRLQYTSSSKEFVRAKKFVRDRGDYSIRRFSLPSEVWSVGYSIVEIFLRVRCGPEVFFNDAN